MKDKNELYFPMVIAITALVIAIISGVINYRQNNLSNLESSLRDTRDQLQLAKSDIADIRMQTVQKLVDAELAYKAQERLEDEKNELRLDLSDAHDRIAELEAQVKNLDQTLEKKKHVSKTRKAGKTTGPKQSGSTTTAIRDASSKSAGHIALSDNEEAEPATPGTADVDIYTLKIAKQLEQRIAENISKKGFTAKFPEKSKSMSMANTTTVFYYHAAYKNIALILVKEFSDMSGSKVTLRKGASPFKQNKIIVHIISD